MVAKESAAGINQPIIGINVNKIYILDRFISNKNLKDFVTLLSYIL